MSWWVVGPLVFLLLIGLGYWAWIGVRVARALSAFGDWLGGYPPEKGD